MSKKQQRHDEKQKKGAFKLNQLGGKWEVERIVTSRGHGRNTKYTINLAAPYNFSGYNTEEPIPHLEGCQKTLTQFRQESHKQRKRKQQELDRIRKRASGEIVTAAERLK